MSEYLKNLQESTLLTESFMRVKGDSITEDQLKEEFKDMLMENESDDVLNEVLSELDVGQAFGSVVMRLSQGEAAVGGGIAAAAIIAFAIKASMRFASNPECKKYSGGSMKKCNTIMKNKKTMAALTSKMTLCKNSKDPSACSAKVKAKIEALSGKIKALGSISGTD